MNYHLAAGVKQPVRRIPQPRDERMTLLNVTFLGVGEACDANQPNTAILLETTGSGRQGQILLDCGFTTPHLYFKDNPGPEDLDALWISHFHGDHFFGTPLLLLRFQEMGRVKSFTILGPAGVAAKIGQAMELAYPGFLTTLAFRLEFLEVSPGTVLSTAGVQWQSAAGEHSQAALAIRLQKDGKAVFYSGDGRPTAATLELARGCDLIIHEAYRVSGDTPGHGSIAACLEFAAAAGAPVLAVLHLQRDERSSQSGEIGQALQAASAFHAFMPSAGDTIVV